MSETVELSTRENKKVVALLGDNFAVDKESFLDDLAEALDVEVSELPRVEITISLKIGSQRVTSSGFEAEEKEESDDSDF